MNNPTPSMSRWTDEEMGVIAATMDRPAKQVAAELGRLPHQVDAARARYRKGGPGKQWWTDDEDSVILSGSLLTAKEVADLLPGRTALAVNQRRRTLGARSVSGSEKSPLCPADRTVIARTCRNCGLLLPALWFGLYRGVRKADCRKCLSQRAIDRDNRRAEPRNKIGSLHEYARKAQAISLESATKYREPYTEEDHKVLADPSLTNLGKALKLSRSYSAAATQVSRNGYKSFSGLGDPERDRWVIDNPNACRVDLIKASLAEQEKELVVTGRPQWDWDEDVA